MEDKILSTKKELKRVLKNPRLTRLEKYNLAKAKKNLLDDKEIKILINECRRDYESFNRLEDIKELITVFLTGLGMLITLAVIFFEKELIGYIEIHHILILVGTYIMLSILCLSAAQVFRTKNMNITRYVLDILEEQ